MSQNRTIKIYSDQAGREPYVIWVDSLKDTQTKARISQRIRRMEHGNFGDHKSVGEGVWELRLDFGPGYRAYYAFENERIVILLCAGSKKTQAKDIAQAKLYWKEYNGGVL